MESKKVLYVLMSGLSSPERTYASFILAADAVATGMRATIYFFLKGVEAVKKGEPEKIKMEGYPPLKQIMERAIHACMQTPSCTSRTPIMRESMVLRMYDCFLARLAS